jgi:hypothetical protein
MATDQKKAINPIIELKARKSKTKQKLRQNLRRRREDWADWSFLGVGEIEGEVRVLTLVRLMFPVKGACVRLGLGGARLGFLSVIGEIIGDQSGKVKVT